MATVNHEWLEFTDKSNQISSSDHLELNMFYYTILKHQPQHQCGVLSINSGKPGGGRVKQSIDQKPKAARFGDTNNTVTAASTYALRRRLPSDNNKPRQLLDNRSPIQTDAAIAVAMEGSGVALLQQLLPNPLSFP